MLIEIPDDALIFLCGGESGETKLGEVVKRYLYGEPEYASRREMTLGVVLVRQLVKQLPN